MKTWEVTLPIVGTAHVIVEADTEQEAVATVLSGCDHGDIETWEAKWEIEIRNIGYAPTRGVTAECVFGGDGASSEEN